MDDRLKKIEDLNQMLKSELITDAEYKSLLKEILDSKVEIVKQSNSNGMQSYSIERLKNAGSNAMYIFYSIIFQIILVFGYWFLIGFKIGYDDATGQSDNFGSLITFVENLGAFAYFIEFFIAFFIILNLYYLGYNLKNVDKQPR
jgi:hypothetical protein